MSVEVGKEKKGGPWKGLSLTLMRQFSTLTKCPDLAGPVVLVRLVPRPIRDRWRSA